jgi:uncharacterized membrane protein
MEMENIMQGVVIFTLLILTFTITIFSSRIKKKKKKQTGVERDVSGQRRKN